MAKQGDEKWHWDQINSLYFLILWVNLKEETLNHLQVMYENFQKIFEILM